MKIIFLDIERVLVTDASYVCARPEQFGRESRFSFSCVKNLNTLIAITNAKIVVSSTWRLGKSVNDLQQLMDNQGANCSVIGKTPIKRDEIRGKEIEEWLNNNRSVYTIDSFIIIDDDNDMGALLNRLIQTDDKLGFTYLHLNQAVNLLQ